MVVEKYPHMQASAPNNVRAALATPRCIFRDKRPFYPMLQIDQRQFLRNRHGHMKVVVWENPAQDFDVVLWVQRSTDVLHARAQLSVQIRETGLGRPDEMIGKAKP